MLAWGQRVSLLAAWVMGMVAAPAAAQGPGAESAAVPASVPASASVPAAGSVPASVLGAPVQGSEALRGELGERVLGAVRRALAARGYLEVASPELLGQAVVACPVSYTHLTLPTILLV